MPVATGSQTRLADIVEATIGTTPSTPTFQIMRYLSSDVRINKQTDVPDEIRSDRNVAAITDVGRTVTGSIKTNLSYGTYDNWLAAALCSTWSTNVLKNGIADVTRTLEWTYEQGATDTFIRAVGCRINTLDLKFTARQAITADWGIMGLDSPAPTNAIITGATYTAATTTAIMNAGLNVSAFSLTGLTNTPKVNSLSLSIKNNIYQNDIVGQYAPDSHGLGRFEVTGSMSTLFENLDTYNAMVGHDDLTLSATFGGASGSRYTLLLPKVKLLDGGPVVSGNNRAVMMDVPFQAYFDTTEAATIKITRAV